jgi:hypothetical protein
VLSSSIASSPDAGRAIRAGPLEAGRVRR